MVTMFTCLKLFLMILLYSIIWSLQLLQEEKPRTNELPVKEQETQTSYDCKETLIFKSAYVYMSV